MDTVKLLEKVNNKKEELFLEISKDIIGQKDVIEYIFIALLCKGHILLEGVPGLGKTLIIKTLTKALDLKFNRNAMEIYSKKKTSIKDTKGYYFSLDDFNFDIKKKIP